MQGFTSTTAILKADAKLGIIFGYAVVTKVDGEPYYDTQDDHIPDEVMVKIAAKFAERSRVGKSMHAGEKVADVVFNFPLSEDIAKALGITAKQHGWLVGFKPLDPAMLAQFETAVEVA